MDFDDDDNDVLIKPKDTSGQVSVGERIMEVVLIILMIAVFVSFFLIVVVF